jgi:NDP-sugar pyrophosphorylase family protein
VECEGAFIDIGVPDDYHRAAEVLSGSAHRKAEDALHH